MEDCLKISVTKEIINGILVRYKSKDVVQCVKCGSVKLDAKELAKTLYAIGQEECDAKEETLAETIVKDQVEKTGLDWSETSKKLIKNGI